MQTKVGYLFPVNDLSCRLFSTGWRFYWQAVEKNREILSVWFDELGTERGKRKRGRESEIEKRRDRKRERKRWGESMAERERETERESK